METGRKATALSRRKTLVIARFNVSKGYMKVDTFNIRSVKIHTPGPPRPSTGGDGGERDTFVSTTTTGKRTVTDPVSFQFFEAKAPDPLNDEAFRVVLANPTAETPGQPLSSLT